MAIIQELNYKDNVITFEVKNKDELKGLQLGENYNFFNTDLKDKIKVVRRGRTEATTYLLMDKNIKEYLSTKFERFYLKDKSNLNLDCELITLKGHKFLIVKL